ncbi:MAG: hypothetical protein M3N32_01405 [Actinomycetota bacterium]|nr:hypothetical protein [Actinomycetota bacterium]
MAGHMQRGSLEAVAPGAGETGSLVTEYGLIAIVGATVASLVVKWATGGAIWQLFDAVTQKVRVLLGA